MSADTAPAAAVIEVDGRRIEAQPGEMLIAAADRAGIYIPRFCYHEKLSIAANCRMCLVEVEKAPKPLPACATPVTAGMKVFTRSKLAREAQAGTMEFLLINHPLDCPVCDQGGECPLQDQAMGYGADNSRFIEPKRAVASHDIGPLVATEMTRCIHCTRCVRFGEEVAGVMEMGLPGRGESAYIGTFLNRSVDSEVSGNMIDLCPVGALTSKPYRFAARSWELQNHRGISPHDCVGANLNIQTLRGRVERVLPIDNPQVNDCWLADRDRYSYEAVNSERRLVSPMVKASGEWRQATWEEALQRVCRGIKQAMRSGDQASGGGHLGVLAGHTATLEEYYLLQKLARGLGCSHIDHRAQQSDFRDDAAAPAFPATELPIAQFGRIKAALLVGANLRKEQPLLALRLRAATLSAHDGSGGARISSLNPMAYAQNFDEENTLIAGADMPASLAGVAVEIARRMTAAGADVALPGAIARWVHAAQPSGGSAGEAGGESTARSAIAEDLLQAGADGVVILGALAQQHEDASVLKAIAQWICQAVGARLAILAAGNGVAAWLAGCLPHRQAGGTATPRPGLDAAAMMARPRRAYLLLASDPELDSLDGKRAGDALRGAEFVARITAYQSDAAMGCADVLLPMAAFTESAGAFVNCEGRLQHAEAAAVPLGESRPAWKILRVLGNFLDLPGFDYVSLRQVTDDIDLNLLNLDSSNSGATNLSARTGDWEMPGPRPDNRCGDDNSLRRLLDLPMYRGDQIVRHAPALQRTADNPAPAARMNSATMERLGLAADTPVMVRDRVDGDRSARLPLRADERVPRDCVYVPAGFEQTARLGGHGRVTVETAPARHAATREAAAKQSATRKP